MIAMKKFGVKTLLASALMAVAISGAYAAEVSGIKFADSAKVGGKELQLNGLGVRTKVIFKVYAAGLYLTEPAATVEAVMKNEGPRRMKLVMMREVASDEFGNSFMSGLNNNLDGQEKTRIVTQISKFGEMFASLPGIKKNDVLDLDYIPGTGTLCFLNGKKIGETVPELLFYTAIMKIWLGEKPADKTLKPRLLNGGKAPQAAPSAVPANA